VNYGIIYCALNTTNNKVYIGQTVKSLERRKQLHETDAKNGMNFHFQRALRKYNKNVWEWNILVVAYCEEELNALEKYWIWVFNSISKGYNIREGGSHGKLNEISKEKISKANKGKKRTDEVKIKISKVTKGKNNPFYGKKHTEEAVQKNIEAHKGKVPWNKGLTKETDERIAKLNEILKNSRFCGRHHTEETKKKLSKSITKARKKSNWSTKKLSGVEKS